MATQVFNNPEEVATAAADRFVQAATEAITSRGRFDVALSGGTTPKRVYQLLASNAYRDRIDWTRVHIFFGDERCVPLDDRESNYRMAREALLSHVPIPSENVSPMQGEGDPNLNAQKYEQELRRSFNNVEWPTFDLVLLGLGEDAHTASLFPGTNALHEDKSWVVANWVEKLNTWRITLTAPAINHAARILFLVTGRGKAKPLSTVISGPVDTEEFPAQLIKPTNGSLEWLIDQAAAELL